MPAISYLNRIFHSRLCSRGLILARWALTVLAIVSAGTSSAQDGPSFQQPELVWSERVAFSNLRYSAFDSSGKKLLATGTETFSFDVETGVRFQIAGAVISITDDGSHIARIVDNGAYGDDQRHRLILSTPGGSQPVFETPEMHLGGFPETLSSRDGRAHILIPTPGATPDNRPILVTATSLGGQRLDLDMSKYPESVAVTTRGEAIVRTRTGLVLFGQGGARKRVLEHSESNFVIDSSDNGARLSVDEDSLFILVRDPDTYLEALHTIDLVNGGSVAEYRLPELERAILTSVSVREDGMRASFYTYGDELVRSAYVFDIFEDRDAVLLTRLDTEADHIRPTLSRDGNMLAVATSDNQLALYSYTASSSPADAPEGPPFPTLVVGLGGLNTLTDIAISPDNRFLATADYQGEVWLWDVASGRAIRSFGLYDRTLLHFGEDGDSLILLVDDSILVFDIRTGKMRQEYSSTGYPFLSFNRVSGGFLVCHIRGCLYRADDKGTQPVALDLPDRLNGAHLCRDQLALYDNRDNGSATVYRTGWTGSEPAGETHRTDLRDTKVRAITCAPGGQVYVGTEDGKVLSLDRQGAVSIETTTNGTKIETLALLPDEALLVGRKGDDSSAHVPASIVALHPGTLEPMLETTVPLAPDGSGRHLDFLQLSDDLTRAVTVTQNPGTSELSNANVNHVVLWDFAALRARIAAATQGVALPPDDFLIAKGIAQGGRKPAGIAFSPDGNRLAVNYRSDSVVWSLETGQVAVHPKHTFGNAVKMSEIGMLLPDSGKGPLFVGWDRSVERLPMPPTGVPDYLWTGLDLIVAENTMAQMANGGALIWRREASGRTHVHFLDIPDSSASDMGNLSRSGDRILVQSHDRLLLQATEDTSSAALWTLNEPQNGTWRFDGTTTSAFSQDGRFVIVPLYGFPGDPALFVLDPENGEIVHRFEHKPSFADRIVPVRVASHGDAPELLALLYVGADGFADLRKSPDDRAPGRVNLLGLTPFSATASVDGRFLVIRGLEDRTLFWDRETGESRFLDANIFPAVAPEHNVAFSPDGALVALSETDGTISIFQTGDATRLARLLGFADGGWAVIGEDGRYDASDPGNVARLSWVLTDDPLYPIPVGSYIQEYFEPRLLGRLLAGEAMPSLPPPQDRNRVIPEVEIIDILNPKRQEDDTTTVTVSLAVKETTRNGGRSGVGTVKLFRDGQLVALDDQVTIDTDGSANILFDEIALAPGEPEIVFSAYAFNDDTIKSETVSKSFSPPIEPEIKVHRRAFVLAVGINAYDNPAWNLRYAAADAEATADVLGEQLRQSGSFDDVIDITLTSRRENRAEGLAKSDLIEAVLRQLAGTARPSDLAIANVPIVPKARPQDLVYVALAGHGLAGEGGEFHFFTQEFGSGLSGRRLPENLAAHTLDSTRLGDLLRAIDTRDMVLVIDACNSAASVQGAGFKPGPMGSKGLGQLAYDKAMRVLTASQAEAVAIESDTLNHGALTYALMREGLEAAVADSAPKNGSIGMGELLSFGLIRVPDLYQSLHAGSFEPLARGAFTLQTNDPENVPYVQQPALFDFRAKDREDLIIGTVN